MAREPIVGVVRAQRIVLLACAGAATLGAWLWLLSSTAHHHAADWRSYLSLVTMWQAMTIAMMTPAVLDWLLTFAALSKKGFGPVGAFAGGYFTIWLGYSVVMALLQMALGGRLPTRAGGAILVAAGVFYFTPFQPA